MSNKFAGEGSNIFFLELVVCLANFVIDRYFQAQVQSRDGLWSFSHSKTEEFS